MARKSRYSRKSAQVTASSRNELMQAKMALVAARERKEPEAFATILGIYSSYAPELTEFDAALFATEGYLLESPTAQTEKIAARALARAMLTVFPAQTTLPAPGAIRGVVANLRELRRSRGFTLPSLAEKLGLGVDVLSSLEGGMVKVASIPDRLIRALGDVLSTSLDQITDLLEMQVSTEPVFKRGTGGTERLEKDFLDLVRASPNMSEDQKALWSDESKMA
jgi:transcriptional regulator with XRE-family HTH domain